MMMNVGDVMQQEVVTLGLSDHLDIADDIMRLGRIRHLPVVSEGRLVGILSQRDLFRAALSSLLQLGYAAEREWLGKVSVRAVMTPTVVTVTPVQSVRAALDLMIERKIGCLPVVEGGRLVGLLTETDCLRCLAHVLDIAEVRERLPELPAS
jgi:CBS domain-containing protein